MTFYFTILCGFLCEKPVIGKERAVTRKPLASRTGPRRHGRGASLPASPCSFVRGHHVSRAQRVLGNADVVLHSPLALIPSSTSTTSLGPSGPPAMRTWCFTPRNPLFLRPRAPRPSGPAGLRQCGRGASPPAIPCSFVRGHHVFEHSSRSRRADVVLHRPLALIPSSPGTTSLGPSGPPAMRTWCFTARNPLFLRRRAPRLSGPAGLRRAGRGASLPASPYSFVRGHHVLETQRAFGAKD